MRIPTLLSVLVLMLATSVHAAPMVPVTTCGQIVPRGATGYLTGDLDCTAVPNLVAAVLVHPGAKLELRGFTIGGGIFGITCYELRDRPGLAPGLFTGGSCRIDGGGGHIMASEAHGISGTKLTVLNLTVDGAGQEGVAADTKARLEGVTITNSGGHGVSARGVSLKSSTITGSGENGVSAKTVSLLDSTVTGNGSGPSCGGNTYPNRCADLLTERRPRLRNSQCETSLVPVSVFPPATWHICQND